MNAMLSRVRRMVPAVAVVSLLAGPALAAPLESPAPPAAQPAAQAPAAKRFSLTVANELPRAALARVGGLTGELILVDSSVQKRLTAEWKDLTAEEAIADACRLTGASWKRVYLPPGTAAVPDNVSQIYRSLRALQAGGLVALDPNTGRGTMLVLNAVLPDTYRNVMEQPNSAFRKAYLVLNERAALVPEATPATAEDGEPWQPGQPLTPAKMARLQKDTFVAISQMTPEQRQAALKASMEAQMGVIGQNPQLLAQIVRESAGMQMQFLVENPQMMRDVMQSAMQAQIEALQLMTPDQRRMLMQTQMEMVKSIPPEQMQQLMELMKGAQ